MTPRIKEIASIDTAYSVLDSKNDAVKEEILKRTLRCSNRLKIAKIGKVDFKRFS